VKLKRIITFTKLPRKKIEIKTRLKNRIPSIWIEGWNWKSLKILQNVKGKKIQRMRTTVENIIFSKLRLRDGIENK